MSAITVQKYGWNSDLTSSPVKRVIEKSRQTGSIGDAKNTGHPKTCRSNANIEAVCENVDESPGTSIRHGGQELQISNSSLQRILTVDLRLHAYKVHLTPELKRNDS
ncbi:52 kDa repressor of the inhibitor of the protein kinase, partial [Nephila pilipes]